MFKKFKLIFVRNPSRTYIVTFLLDQIGCQKLGMSHVIHKRICHYLGCIVRLYSTVVSFYLKFSYES